MLPLAAKSRVNARVSGSTRSEQRYRRGLLSILALILAFNFVDRLALGIMLESIKADLALTDTQLGALTGLAFAVFYAVMGIPIARWADRGNRVKIIALTTALWSAAVALCGAATSFAQLLVIRMTIGVGEAGCQPPALSLISDEFERPERPRAVSRYKLGWPIALVVGNLAAGWLNQYIGWRLTFVLLGIPGIILSVLVWLGLREPRIAHGSSELQVHALPPQELTTVLRTLWGNRAYRHLLFSMCLSYFFAFGILQWQPAFFIRRFGLGTGELGTWLALVYGTAGLAGTFLGGELAARFAPNDEARQLRGTALLYILLGLLTAAVFLAPSYHIAFLILAIASLGGAACNGPIFSATQTLVSPEMRAMALAVVLMFANLLGTGLGPLLVGILSDQFRPQFGEDGLRLAILCFCPGYLWCAWHLWRCSQHANEAATKADPRCSSSTADGPAAI